MAQPAQGRAGLLRQLILGTASCQGGEQAPGPLVADQFQHFQGPQRAVQAGEPHRGAELPQTLTSS